MIRDIFIMDTKLVKFWFILAEELILKFMKIATKINRVHLIWAIHTENKKAQLQEV